MYFAEQTRGDGGGGVHGCDVGCAIVPDECGDDELHGCGAGRDDDRVYGVVLHVGQALVQGTSDDDVARVLHSLN